MTPTPPSTPHSAKSVPEEWKVAAKEIDEFCDVVDTGPVEMQKSIALIIARHSPGWVKIEEGKPNNGDTCLIEAFGVVQWIAMVWEYEKFAWPADHFTESHGEFPQESITRWFRIPAPPSEGETKK